VTRLCYFSAKEQTACCEEYDVKIFSSGLCVWNREFQLSVTHCELDVTWFPFDNQACDIIYESKTKESRELNFTSKRQNPVGLNMYSPNGEWELTGKTTQLHGTKIYVT